MARPYAIGILDPISRVRPPKRQSSRLESLLFSPDPELSNRPQLEPQAISHLCSTLKATIIFVDEAHYYKTSGLENDIKGLKIPSYRGRYVHKGDARLNERRQLPDIAYFVHTSGTSSGLPKAIPQTHQGLVGSLPRFLGDNKSATFTTTPLYHGGLVDCFRAWTSGAMIWFFPEGAGPITARNLHEGINFARSHNSADVKYFTSVPYVLQILAEEDYGIQLLRTMDLVAFGGAALPAAVGDRLVEAGVHLLSRLGSAECGFLMSSHRNYPIDKAWQYLRPTIDASFLSFEPKEDGLSELIVKSRWPYKVKENRDDSAYATADLFQPHSSIPNAWRYHSRADAQITLVNGKKFDPAPIEASILAANKFLKDVFVFGNNKEFAGALLFPVSDKLSQESVVDNVWPQVEEMNRLAQGHARIARSMLMVVKANKGQEPLKKSSKGSILRPQAELRYAEAIQSAYVSNHVINSPLGELCDEELLPTVMNCFTRVLGHIVHQDKDLYHQGVDSIASSQIRTCIEATCLSREKKLPMNIIYDKGTVTSLVAYLRQLRSGTQSAESNDRVAQLQLMRELVTKHSHFEFRNIKRCKQANHAIVLTGSTGFLGVHILDLLSRDCRIEKVYCLVRAPTPSVARDRVYQALQKYGLSGGRDLQGSRYQDSKVVCLPFDLSSRSLSLSETDRHQILREATIYIHPAWTVNFNLPLQSFENQIAGMQYLMNAAIEGGAHFVFISSLAAVSHIHSRTAVEKTSDIPTDASPLGYAQSKWVAERICAAANKSVTVRNEDLRPISIIRIGQLCGNDAGIWNTTEAYPLMFSTAKIIHCLPRLTEIPNWLPVDKAARGVLDIILSQGIQPEPSDHEKLDPPVYHVLNPCKTPTWDQMLQWVTDEAADETLEITSPSEWLQRLGEKLEVPDVSHPSQALLCFWKSLISQKPNLANSNDPNASSVEFETSLAMEVSETMRAIQPLDRPQFIKMWRWIMETI